MTNIQKAIAIIESFSTGDTKMIKKFVAKDYIQHNLQIPTGRDAFIDVVKHIANLDINTIVLNIRSFEDGEFVILQSLYNFAGAGEQVAFDIFRFEDGLIVEHWDNIVPTTKENPSGHIQVDGIKNIVDINKTTENKKLVVDFVTEVMLNKKFDILPSFFEGDNYIQHDSNIADGLSGLSNALEEMTKNHTPMVYKKIHYVFGRGNFVLVVSEGTNKGVHTSYYDLFRVHNLKIAEHWDVMEPIAQKAKHSNGKF